MGRISSPLSRKSKLLPIISGFRSLLIPQSAEHACRILLTHGTQLPAPYLPETNILLTSRVVLLVQSPRLSFTAISISCSDPRYRSVVWIEERPSKNFTFSRSPPLLRQSLAQVLRRS